MLRGGCLCGGVRYEVEGRPFHETVCYCVDCRRAIGAVSVAWFTVSRDGFRLTAGVPTSYRSSPEVTRGFCGTCGTSLSFEHDALPGELDLATATLDDPNAASPKDHVHTSSRPDWVVLCDGLPAFPGAREEP